MLESLSLAAISFAPGLAIGSFLNVIASRVPIHKPIGTSRSVCMSCDAQIRGYDNIPLVSYLVLRGRCRDCKATIPVRYPLVELGTALLVAASFAAFGLTWDALLAAGFCVVLVVLTAIDIEHRIVPNRIVLPAAAVMLVAHTLVDPSPEWALGALAAFATLFVDRPDPAGWDGDGRRQALPLSRRDARLERVRRASSSGSSPAPCPRSS